MAHECPECGLRCHCNGDIDDLVFSDEDTDAKCDHWRKCRPDEYADDGEDYQRYHEE